MGNIGPLFEDLRNSEQGGVGHIVRLCGGTCLETPDAVAAKEWSLAPISRAEVVVLGGRSPFPSIPGGHPVDQRRPYLDLRR